MRTHKRILLDRNTLAQVLVNNSELDMHSAQTIIDIALTVQSRNLKHEHDCSDDQYTCSVCSGTYQDKCDDVIELCEALRAVYALAGENKQVEDIVSKAIREHGDE